MFAVIVAGKDHLRGWKEIAEYLARDERTVKRWEKQRGLPVRRIPGSGRANVYILVPELETWLAAVADSLPAAEESVDGPVEADEQLVETVLEEKPEPLHAPPKGLLRRWPVILATVAGAAGIAVASFALLGSFFARHPQMKPLSDSASRSTVYSSPKGGVDELYLQGLYFYEQRTPASLEHAHQAFEQVIASDPKYAPAYAGLANTYLLLREFSTMPPEEAYAKATVAAKRAIALDPNFADAHTALGFIDFFSAWNAAAATKEFETALRLDPSCAVAHHWYGSMLTHEGRYAEALVQLNEAQRLQPTSSAILASKAYALGLGGHRNEATDMLQSMLTADPNAVPAHRILATLSLVEPRDIPRFLYESRRLAEVRNDPESLSTFEAGADAFRSGGETAMWSAILDKERQFHPSREHPIFLMIEAEAALGQNDQALEDLNTLADQRAHSMIGVVLDPTFTTLREGPRFERILAKVGLTLPRR